MRIAPPLRSAGLLFAAALATGCYVEAFTGTDGVGTNVNGSNVPVVGLSADGLGYTLKAKDFTSDQQYGPVVQTQSVSVATAVIGYTSGSATLEIRDATSSIVLEQTVTSNLAQGSSLVHGTAPFKVSLTFRHFSGTFSLGVGPGESSPSR